MVRHVISGFHELSHLEGYNPLEPNWIRIIPSGHFAPLRTGRKEAEEFKTLTSQQHRMSSLDRRRFLSLLPYVDPNICDEIGRTALHRMAICGDMDTVRSLLGHQMIDLDKVDHQGKTPFILAYEAGQVQVCNELLNHDKVNPNLEMDHGRTPLFWECAKGGNQIIDRLLAHSQIQVNKPDDYGWTPLHVACEDGHVEIVKKLLKHDKIEPMAVNPAGQTALQIACTSENQPDHKRALVKLLIDDARIDLTHKDKLGLTALDELIVQKEISLRTCLNEQQLARWRN